MLFSHRFSSKALRLAACAVTSLTFAATAFAQDMAHYGDARGWSVVSFSNGGAFVGCGMHRPTQNGGFGLVNENGNWLLTFPASLPNGAVMEMYLEVDRASFPLNATVYDGEAQAYLTPQAADAIARGRHMETNYHGLVQTYSLKGTTAGKLKVEECIARRGNVYAVTAPAPSPSPAAPQVVENDAYRLGAGCPAPGSFRSPDAQDWGDITFVNRSSQAVTLYWLDLSGQPVEITGLLPGESNLINSTAGHYFIAKDFQGSCHGGVIEVPYGQTVYDIW